MTLAKQLEDEEGRVGHAYQDHLGYWTIGIGRLIDRRKNGGLSNAEIDLLLANDIDSKTREVVAALPWVAELDLPRRAAVLGMAFQMGTQGLLQFKNTLELIRTKRYAEASRAMLQSLWARQTPERAHRMSEQVRTGAWQWK